MHKGKSITMKHLLIDGNKCIGLQFSTDRVIQALVEKLPNLEWSETFCMHYIPNNKNNISLIFKMFRGEAWINGNFFFAERVLNNDNADIDVEWFRKRKLEDGFRPCPEEYLLKLELKRYSNNTVKAYVNCFEAFINYYGHLNPIDINENEIR